VLLAALVTLLEPGHHRSIGWCGFLWRCCPISIFTEQKPNVLKNPNQFTALF